MEGPANNLITGGKHAHTPGPWIVFVDRGGDSAIYSILPAGRAGTIASDIENSDDASVIAAAPRMFDYISRRAESGDQEAAHILGEIHVGRRAAGGTP